MSPKGTARPQRLCVVSHVVHYAHDGRLWAYAPYAREIDIWADLFPALLIASPLRHEPPPGSAAAFTRSNIDVAPQPEVGGDTALAKLGLLVAQPRLVWSLVRALRRCDAVHVRGPGNLGALGTLVAPLFHRRLVAKFAGSWMSFPGEPKSVSWQKTLLRSRWWRGPVTVYGAWPGQPPHVVPFFTSVLTADQVARAGRAAGARSLTTGSETPLRLLFVGRLSASKNVDALIEATAQLCDDGHPVDVTIVGDGPEEPRLKQLAMARGIADRVDFRGSLPLDDVLGAYEAADVSVLISETEGWPKAIAEAMAFGLVCIGSDRGLVPQMLGEGRGHVVPAGDARALATRVAELQADPASRLAMAQRAAHWARAHSLEGLRDAIGDLLADRWGLPPGTFDVVEHSARPKTGGAGDG